MGYGSHTKIVAKPMNNAVNMRHRTLCPPLTQEHGTRISVVVQAPTVEVQLEFATRGLAALAGRPR